MSVVFIVRGEAREGREGRSGEGVLRGTSHDRQYGPVCPVSEWGIRRLWTLFFPCMGFCIHFPGVLWLLSRSPGEDHLQSSLEGMLESNTHPVFYWPSKCRARLNGRDLDPPLNKQNRKRTWHYTLYVCMCMCMYMYVCVPLCVSVYVYIWICVCVFIT